MDKESDEKHSALYHAMIPSEGHEVLVNIQVPDPQYCWDDVVKMKWQDTLKGGTINVVESFGTYK